MNIQEILSKLSVREKAVLCVSGDQLCTAALPDRGIPRLVMTDGTTGVRILKTPPTPPEKAQFRTAINASFDSPEALAVTEEATCFPAGSSLACSWDPSLAEDVFGFLPELMAQAVLPQVKVTSRFSVSRHGAGQTSVWFTQCRAWAPVYSAIMDHFHEDGPTKDQIMSIVGTSAMFHGLNNALNSGSKVEDLMMSRVFTVSESYQLW